MFNLSEEQEERAQRLHKESIIVDALATAAPSLGAQYTPSMLKRARELVKEGVPLRSTFRELERMHTEEMISGKSHIEREWMELSGVDVFHITTVALGGLPFEETPAGFERALEGVALWQRKFDSLDYLVKVTTSKDIEEARERGKRAIIMGFQDSNYFGMDLNKLQWFYDLGIRVVQLTMNLRNYAGNGCIERSDGGLSIFGIELVKRMNELGMLVDVAHCGYQTTMDAIEISRAPVIVSHSSSRKVYDHPRGKTDEQIRALAEHNGFFGVVTVPFFITDLSRKKASLNDFLDHLDHIVEIMGVDKVGIATDYPGATPEPMASKINEHMAGSGFRNEHGIDAGAVIEGFRDWREWPNITRGLVSRGYTDDEIRGILGGNFLRVFKEVVG